MGLGEWITLGGIVANVAIVLYLAPAIQKNRDSDRVLQQMQMNMFLMRYQIQQLMTHAGIAVPPEPPNVTDPTAAL